MTIAVQNTGVEPRRRWRWALILSLALNVLLLGMIGGAVWRGTGGGPWGGPRAGSPGQLFGFVTNLPPERRATILRELRVSRGEVRALRQHVRQAQRERIDALTAEPFDRQRLIEAQTRLDNAEARLRQMLANLMQNAAGSMTAEERRAFARWRPVAGGFDRDGDSETPGPKR